METHGETLGIVRPREGGGCGGANQYLGVPDNMNT
jgi:hypothetical protein